MAEPGSETSIVNPANLATGLMFGLAALGWMAQRFFKAFSPGPEDSKERVVIEKSDFVDWKAIQISLDTLCMYSKRIAESQETVVMYEKKKADREDLALLKAEERARLQEEQSRKMLQDKLDRLTEAEEREQRDRKPHRD